MSTHRPTYCWYPDPFLASPCRMHTFGAFVQWLVHLKECPEWGPQWLPLAVLALPIVVQQGREGGGGGQLGVTSLQCILQLIVPTARRLQPSMRSNETQEKHLAFPPKPTPLM